MCACLWCVCDWRAFAMRFLATVEIVNVCTREREDEINNYNIILKIKSNRVWRPCNFLPNRKRTKVFDELIYWKNLMTHVGTWGFRAYCQGARDAEVLKRETTWNDREWILSPGLLKVCQPRSFGRVQWSEATIRHSAFFKGYESQSGVLWRETVTAWSTVASHLLQNSSDLQEIIWVHLMECIMMVSN